MMMYFCQMKVNLVPKTSKHMMYTSVRHFKKYCNLWKTPSREREVLTLRDFFWYLTAFLVSSFALLMYSAALDTFTSMLFTISPCKRVVRYYEDNVNFQPSHAQYSEFPLAQP